MTAVHDSSTCRDIISPYCTMVVTAAQQQTQYAARDAMNKFHGGARGKRTITRSRGRRSRRARRKSTRTRGILRKSRRRGKRRTRTRRIRWNPKYKYHGGGGNDPIPLSPLATQSSASLAQLALNVAATAQISNK